MIHIDQEVDIEAMIDEIEFNWCLGGDILMNCEKCIPLKRLYKILGQYLPQIKQCTDEQLTTNNR